jgi:hypothetical protein
VTAEMNILETLKNMFAEKLFYLSFTNPTTTVEVAIAKRLITENNA